MTLWVFGYGSLVWNPGFEFREQRTATLEGYARSFCMRSIHHRGTQEAPGLVLALDAQPEATCHGVLFGVDEDKRPETLAYLRERELVSAAYLEKWLPVKCTHGQTVEALCYVIDPDHVQYCGGLPLEEQAQIIATAHGGRGANSDYLFNTAQHLDALGIGDTDLQWLVKQVKTHLG